MVVPEESTPKNTTTSEIKESTNNILKLDYTLSTKDEITSTNEIENKILKNSDSDIIEIPFIKGIETGLEISYTSLKLKEFPLKENNLPLYEDIIENISLNSCNLNINNLTLFNVNIRVLNYKKFKLIEFKTREFKLALSIQLFDDKTIRKAGDYFSYEIFSKLKDIRLIAVANIFKLIFSGEVITFNINDLVAEIQFENPIQVHKFDKIIESVKKYEKTMKLLHISKWRNFSEASIKFYTLHLLHNYINNIRSIDTWINFKLYNKYNIKPGDKISFTRIHELNIRGFNYNLKEEVSIKSSISNTEIDNEKNFVFGYRKIVNLKLTTIQKY